MEIEKSLTDSFLTHFELLPILTISLSSCLSLPSLCFLATETESDSEKTVKIKKRSNAYGKTRIRTVLNEKQLHTLRFV